MIITRGFSPSYKQSIITRGYGYVKIGAIKGIYRFLYPPKKKDEDAERVHRQIYYEFQIIGIKLTSLAAVCKLYGTGQYPLMWGAVCEGRVLKSLQRVCNLQGGLLKSELAIIEISAILSRALSEDVVIHGSRRLSIFESFELRGRKDILEELEALELFQSSDSRVELQEVGNV